MGCLASTSQSLIRNLAQLVPIKAKYDPDNLLECWMCIGWNATQATTNPRYACYP